MEKYIEIQKDVYHKYMYWYKVLWSCMGNVGISQEIINLIESLC